jgi:alpha-1,4-galacturonosyltransferase
MRPIEGGAFLEIKSVDEFTFINSSYVLVLRQVESAKMQQHYIENQGDKGANDAGDVP